MLGRVLHHRDNSSNLADPEFRLTEALSLHKMLVTLDNDLQRYLPDAVNAGDHAFSQTAGPVAYALCATARFVLYNLYGCNEPDATSSAQGRIMLETEMQQAALEGIRSMPMEGVAQLIKGLPIFDGGGMKELSPFLGYLCYHAASECAWFVQEGKLHVLENMGVYLGALRAMEGRWRVAGEFRVGTCGVDVLTEAGLYLKLLEHEGALRTFEDATTERMQFG
jgi:hypothetical protein